MPAPSLAPCPRSCFLLGAFAVQLCRQPSLTLWRQGQTARTFEPRRQTGELHRKSANFSQHVVARLGTRSCSHNRVPWSPCTSPPQHLQQSRLIFVRLFAFLHKGPFPCALFADPILSVPTRNLGLAATSLATVSVSHSHATKHTTSCDSREITK